MKSLREYLYRRPISSVLILIVIELLIVHFFSVGSNLLLTVLKEGILAAIAIFFIYVVDGKGEISFSSKGIGYAFKKCWWALVIAVMTGGLAFIGVLGAHKPLVDNAILIFLEVLIFGVFIGLFEEGLFRGLFLNALLTKYGETKRGILTAMIISSLLFGFVHVVSAVVTNILHPAFFTPIVISQVLGKTIQTGMLGFLLAAVYLKNHNIWSVAIIHGLNDFSEFLPGYLYNTASIGGYVGNEAGINSLIAYLIFIALSIPMVIIGYRILNRLSLPQPGMFRVCWIPTKVKKS